MAKNCTICGKKIELSPSAAERAAKDCTGKTAAYYTNLFTTHSQCQIDKRKEDLSEFLRNREVNRDSRLNSFGYLKLNA